MFRDGQYLEVIKVSNNCLATAVITIQKKTIEVKKRKITTNKWLQIEDWVALYKILEDAVLQNDQNGSHRKDHKCKWRKSTRQLEVTYTFESFECASDTTSLPTIRVHVSPTRKKSMKRQTSEETSKSIKTEARTDDEVPKHVKEQKSYIQTNETKNSQLKSIAEEQISPRKRKYIPSYDDLENGPLEEYIPDAPKIKPNLDFSYIPSQKSTLENMRLIANEYTPTAPCDSKNVAEDMTNYVPNPIGKLETAYEIYEPQAITMISNDLLKEYVPNSKGIKSSIEEYEPDFKSPNKMKFDDSYVPSSTRQNNQDISKRTPDKLGRLRMQRLEARRKGTPVEKKMEDLFS